MKANDIKEIFDDIDTYKSIFEIMIRESTVYVDRLADYITDTKIKQIKRYQDAGFSREEAILLVIDSANSISKSLNNIKNNQTSKDKN